MNIGELIPQVFYDFIGRIAPGITLLSTAIILWWDELDSFRIMLKYGFEQSSFYTGISILLAAYVIAFIIEGFRYTVKSVSTTIAFYYDDFINGGKSPNIDNTNDSLNCMCNSCLEINSNSEGKTAGHETGLLKNNTSPCNCEKCQNQLTKNNSDTYPGKMIKKSDKNELFCKSRSSFCNIQNSRFSRVSIALAKDYIRIEQPEAGARIVKLKAELTLFNTLIYGWSFTLFVYISYLVSPMAISDYHAPAKIVVSIASLLFAIICIRTRCTELYNNYLSALYNNWLIMHDKKTDKQIKAPAECKQNQ